MKLLHSKVIHLTTAYYNSLYLTSVFIQLYITGLFVVTYGMPYGGSHGRSCPPLHPHILVLMYFSRRVLPCVGG